MVHQTHNKEDPHIHPHIECIELLVLDFELATHEYMFSSNVSHHTDQETRTASINCSSPHLIIDQCTFGGIWDIPGSEKYAPVQTHRLSSRILSVYQLVCAHMHT